MFGQEAMSPGHDAVEGRKKAAVHPVNYHHFRRPVNKSGMSDSDIRDSIRGMEATRPKPRILIVEDEPIVGLEISDSLERMGYSVCPVVSSGDKVLEAALRENPDLI